MYNETVVRWSICVYRASPHPTTFSSLFSYYHYNNALLCRSFAAMFDIEGMTQYQRVDWYEK
jgi:hypothetical protein